MRIIYNENEVGTFDLDFLDNAFEKLSDEEKVKKIIASLKFNDVFEKYPDEEKAMIYCQAYGKLERYVGYKEAFESMPDALPLISEIVIKSW